MSLATTTVYGRLVDLTAAPLAGVRVTARLDTPPDRVVVGADGSLVTGDVDAATTTAADGTFSLPVIRSALLTPSGIETVILGPRGERLARLVIPTATAVNLRGTTVGSVPTLSAVPVCTITATDLPPATSPLVTAVLDTRGEVALLTDGTVVLPMPVVVTVPDSGALSITLIRSTAFAAGIVRLRLTLPGGDGHVIVIPDAASAALADLI